MRNKSRSHNTTANARRLAALTSKETASAQRKSSLSAARLAARIDAYQNNQLDSALPAINAESITLYCRKSGVEVATISGDVAESYRRMSDADRALFWRNTQHPRWFNTSPENLRANLLTHPHEFAVYAYCILARDDLPAATRHTMLAALRTWPLESVIEYAELLRRALGLFGRVNETAQFSGGAAGLVFTSPLTHSATECLDDIFSWIAAWIAIIQKRYHASNIDRARVVTLSDIKNFTVNVGMALFREARVGRDSDDDSLDTLADVMEIFSAADLREMRAAVSYKRKTEKPGLFDDIDFSSGADAANPSPAADASVFASNEFTQSRTLSAANASRKINLFGDK